MKQLKALGLDPGTHRIGYGFVTKLGEKLESKTYGVIEFKPKEEENRLLLLEKKVMALIKKGKPDVVGIEKLYFSKNTKTAMAVAESRGILLLAASKCKIPIIEYNPTTVKQRVTGYGQSDKKAVLKMIKLLLGIKNFTSLDDASDALALGMVAAIDTDLERRFR